MTGTSEHDPGSSGWWWIPGGMLAAATAAIVAWVFWPPSEDLLALEAGDAQVAAQEVAQSEAIPTLALETKGELELPTGDDAGPHRYRRETKFEWLLQPEAKVEGPLGLRAFAFAGDALEMGLPLSLDALTEISAAGSIRVAGTIGELGLEPGSYTIVLVVGRPQRLPEQAALVREGDKAGSWRTRQVAILIES